MTPSTEPRDQRGSERVESNNDAMREREIREQAGAFADANNGLVQIDAHDFAFLLSLLDEAPKDSDDFGLPFDESPERDAVCDLVTAALLRIGETALHAGERTTVNLCDEQEIRGLIRYWTAVDAGGRDGFEGEYKQSFWRDLGRVLHRSLRTVGETELAGGGLNV